MVSSFLDLPKSAGIIALLLIIALFTKKEYGFEREITIDKPSKVVFDYVKLLKNQANYSKWATMDPNMQRDLKGIDGTVGFWITKSLILHTHTTLFLISDNFNLLVKCKLSY